ncbi:MAG: motility protein A [Mariprofundaceae bacterium]
MDIATLIGIIVAFGLVVLAIQLGGSITSFIDPVSMLIVVGGTIGVVLISSSLKSVLGVFGVAMKTFFYKAPSLEETMQQFVEFAKTVRKDGLLALESEVGGIDDDFLSKGLQMAIDGQEPKSIEDILYLEIDKIGDRHTKGVDMLNALGSYAPSMGMIGTLVGLVLMLQNMADPSSIGPAMAVALLTTFYGALMANILFLPMANKLKVYSKDELATRELMVTGIMSLLAGENPRIMEEKLMRYLPPKSRQSSFD